MRWNWFRLFYFKPERSRKILRGLFGKSFKSTIIRPSAFFAVVTILVLPLVLVLPADETSKELHKFGLVWIAFLGALSVVGNAILASWIGWGVAHWRFRERPAGVWPFWSWPALSGAVLYGGIALGLIFSMDSVGGEAISSAEKVFSVVFATAAGPFFGMIGATFFRYTPYVTALGSGREISEESGDCIK